MQKYQFIINEAFDGQTVGQYLKKQHGYSTRTLVKLKHSPIGLLCNGQHIRTVDALHTGDVLSVSFDEPEKEILCSSRRVEILYEDEHLLIYNKPPDMPCHTSCGHAQDTLENVYAAHCAKTGDAPRLRALNRLDKDTSGCVLAAKNQFIASRLTGRFEKKYRAFVEGCVQSDGRIEKRIYRPDPQDMRRTVDERGQVAITEYGVLRRGSISYLQLSLLTGRTHQIRVHMASIGFPVLGDACYGNPSPLIPRQALHCYALRFTHPVTDEEIHLTAPLAPDMARILSLMQKGGFPCEL